MAVAPPTQTRPLRREEYDQLVELGRFQGEKIELLYGELVHMSPIGARHTSAVQELGALLIRALEGRATVRIQSPFAALDTSEPEPDVAVVPLGRYAEAHAAEAYLIIEVAESSLAFDRIVKQRLYAESRVPEYWVVNVAEKCIEVYREPKAEAYARLERIGHGGSIAPERFPDVVIRVADVIA
jgi:Uma2 family endonuclease